MKQFEFANSQFKQHSDERARLGAEQLTEQLAVSDRAIDFTGQLTRLLPNAIYAVRNELNLPLDLAFCCSLWDSQREKMVQTWQEAKARMHKLTEAVTANKK
jgi:hypothetical protein